MRALMTAVFLFVGCSSCVPRFEEPTVDFRSLNLEEMKQAEVRLLIANPNRFAIDVRNLHYFLLLTGDTVAVGSRAVPVHVNAQDSLLASFLFEVRMKLGDMVGRVPDIADDTVRLVLRGEHSLPGLLGTTWRRFDYERTIPLRPEIDKLLAPLRRLFGGD